MSQDTSTSALLHPTDTFVHRHIGPGTNDTTTMLHSLGYDSLEALMDTVRVASLGQITHALYAVGGEYRRNL